MGLEKQPPEVTLTGTNAVDTEDKFLPLLRGDEVVKFSNLHRFITETGKDCSGKFVQTTPQLRIKAKSLWHCQLLVGCMCYLC